MGPDGFTSNSTKRLKIDTNASQTLQKKNEEEETLPNSLCETSITLILKPHKDTTRNQNYR